MGVDSPDDCAIVSAGVNQTGQDIFNVHSVRKSCLSYVRVYVFTNVHL